MTKNKKSGAQAGRFFETNIYGRNFGPMLEPDGLGGGAPPAGGNPPGGGGEQTPFNPEAFQSEMKDFVLKAVNGAVSTHLTRALDNRFEQNNAALVEQIQSLIPQPPAPGEGVPAPADDIQAAINNATAPLIKQLEEQRALNERNASAAKAERESRMKQEETTALTQALTSSGVAGPLAQAAVNLLHGSLERQQDGSIVYVSKENGPTGPYDERVSVEEGVKRFLATEDGKHFLPARPVSGSGNRGGAAPGVSPGQETDADFVGRMLSGLMG